MKRLLLLLTLAIAPAFSQTPCVDLAKTGKIGSCLDSTPKLTRADAQFVGVSPIKGYNVDPDVPYNISLEFCTREQALAVIELIKSVAPGSELVLTDNGETQFSFPPFRTLKYFNAGGMFDLRVFNITGTIQLSDGSQFLTAFEPGFFINVHRLIYGGSLDTQQSFPFGKDRLVVVMQLGGAFPKWVGKQ